MGEFNSEPSEPAISDFCEIYNTKNIIKEKMCFKNPENWTCVDLILTNKQKGFSDFHKISVTIYYQCKNVLLQANTVCNYLQKI